MKKIFILLFTLIISYSYSSFAQDHSMVKYGPEDRQFLDIYIASSSCPTPVFFHAHSNGSDTKMPSSIIDSLKANGISTVSWESLTSVNTPSQVQTGWDDAELMFAWVKANASTYNFDTTNFIIGGSSRGSILSWKYGHRGDPNIKGLYMYNALPDGVWQDSSWWYPPSEVTPTSPPLFFVYRFEPGTTDIHDPENGIKILDTYTSLGIGDRDTLIHSIQASGNNDRFQFLVDFALSVIQPCPATSISPLEREPLIRAFPNPFQDHLEFIGLQGNEQFVLTNAIGKEIWKGNDPDLLQVIGVNPGIYFLTIRRKDYRQVIKLMKR